MTPTCLCEQSHNGCPLRAVPILLQARAPEVGILISQFEGGDGWRWDKKLRFLHKVQPSGSSDA